MSNVSDNIAESVADDPGSIELYASDVIDVMIATAEQERLVPNSVRPRSGTIDAAAAGNRAAIRRLWSAIQRARQRSQTRPTFIAVTRIVRRVRSRSRATRRVGSTKPSALKSASDGDPPPPSGRGGAPLSEERRARSRAKLARDSGARHKRAGLV